MIYLGTDIVEVNRIRNNLAKKEIKFLNKIFTKEEISYCNSKPDPAIHFAGRFAGKEAVKKALLSSSSRLVVSMKEIEIISSDRGPIINMPTIKSDIKVSISHTDDFAVATAVLLMGNLKL